MTPGSDPFSDPLPEREGLKVEFKSDRKGYSHDDIVAAIICLANTEGGDFFLGVEDDGTITGLSRTKHRDADGLCALVASKTTPRLSVSAKLRNLDGKEFLHVRVPRAPAPTSRSDGLFQRRQMKLDGTPECVAMHTHEIIAHGQGRYQADPTEGLVHGADASDLDPLERERLRTMISQDSRADQELLGMEDDELDRVLGLTQDVEGKTVATVLGLLLIGREEAIRRLLPTHEVAIQFFRDTTLLINEHLRQPLLKVADRLFQLYALQPAEAELAIGLHRIPVPTVDREAFREAVLNAFVHRDYAFRQPVIIRWDEEEVRISSPGGFISGIGPDTLLNAPPRSRNQGLADALKRLGLVERSGRGVDRIYEGQARYGRRLPDYQESTDSQVIVVLDRGPADLEFAQAVLELERVQGRRLTVPEVLILASLRRHPRLTLSELAAELQVSEARARQVTERLSGSQLIAAHGRTRARFFVLGDRFLTLLSEVTTSTAYVTISDEEQVAWILATLAEKGRITRSEVIDRLGLTQDQAKHRLSDMTAKGLIELRGEKRGSHYVLPGTT